MHLKLVRGHLLWNAPLSELLFSCLGHLEGGGGYEHSNAFFW